MRAFAPFSPQTFRPGGRILDHRSESRQVSATIHLWCEPGGTPLVLAQSSEPQPGHILVRPPAEVGRWQRDTFGVSERGEIGQSLTGEPLGIA